MVGKEVVVGLPKYLQSQTTVYLVLSAYVQILLYSWSIKYTQKIDQWNLLLLQNFQSSSRGELILFQGGNCQNSFASLLKRSLL